MSVEDRWRHCGNILENEPDAASSSWKRLVGVPAASLGLVVVILVTITPPFVCVNTGARGSRLSFTRILIWSIISAGLVAVLVACGVYRKKKKAHVY